MIYALTIKILATSDLHGELPTISAPADLLALIGDIFIDASEPEQMLWLRRELIPWLSTIPVNEVLLVGGNHDFVLETKVCREFLAREDLPVQVTYLEDKTIERNGLTIHGSPWTHRPTAWAFNREEDLLYDTWKNLAEIDILMTHSPPYGILDEAFNGKWMESMGSKSLLKIVESNPPKLHLFGHIHPAAGVKTTQETTFVNVSRMAEAYNPINPFLLIDTDGYIITEVPVS